MININIGPPRVALLYAALASPKPEVGLDVLVFSNRINFTEPATKKQKK
jgi:hypothetical protein